MSQNRIRLYATSAMTAATLSLLPMQAAKAAPQGGVVVGGDINATISVNGSATKINQTALRAAINWTSFNVDKGESVTFNVPNNGATLNTVTGNVLTTIKGEVTSNGTLYLVNPNGFVFDTGSKVHAQNFVATTGTIDATKFLENKSGEKLTMGLPTAHSTINLRGEIKVADRGVIGIFAPQINNSSKDIFAKLGSVNLAGAQVTTIDFIGDGLMTFEVGNTASNANYNNSINNSGTITANGGTVTMTASGSYGIINSGTIDVSNTDGMGGTVNITSSDGFSFESGTRILAAGSGNYGSGGINIVGRGGQHYGHYINGGTFDGGGGGVSIATNGSNELCMYGNITVKGSKLKIDLLDHTNGSSGYLYFGWNQSDLTLTALGVDFTFTGYGYYFGANGSKVDLGDGHFIHNKYLVNANGGNYMIANQILATGDIYELNMANTIKLNNPANYGYGLVVYNGSATISGVTGSSIALKDNAIVPTNLKSITANGITVTGNNVFSGDIQLVSYGSVSTPLTGPAVGINIQNGASITTTGSLSLEQRNNVSTTVGRAYGIVIDRATLTVGKDLTLSNYGNISSSRGVASGIYIMGDSSSQSSLSAGGDLRMNSAGTISSTSTSGSAYGIMIDASSGGKASLSAGKDVIFGVNGTIYTTNMNAAAFGVMINGASSSEFKLSAGKDMLVAQHAIIASKYSNGYGIYVGGTATLNANNDINFLQKGAIFGSMGAYGIKVDGKGGVATLNANNDINFTQGGAITGSGATYGILVDGSTSGSTALTAIHDINFTQNGTVSASGTGGNAYGILVDGSASGNATLKTIGHNIILTQNGLVDSVAGDAISLHINGMSGRTASLDSGNDVIITSNNSSRSHAGLKNSLGIYLYDARVKAKNDIIIDQIGDSQSDRGGSFGLLIYNTTRPQSPDYSLYAIRDVRFTENGIVNASGKFNYAVGVVAENARIVAGRNVVGYQGGDVSQNYNGEAAGFHITGSEINAGNPDNINQADPRDNADKLKPGSIYLGQSGNINDVSPTPALTNDAQNQRAPASKLTVDTDTRKSFVKTTIDVPHLPVPNTKGVAYGVYLDSSQFFATKDITINQTGILNDVQQINGGDYKDAADGKYGIYLASSGTDSNKTLTLSAGSEDGTINLTSDGNNVALALVADKTPNKRGIWSQLPGSFTAKAGSLHIDLGGGNFNAGTQMLDATSVGNLIITLPREDTSPSSKYITGGKLATYFDPILNENTSIVVAINMGKNGKVTRVTTLEQNQTIDGKFDITSANLDDLMPMGVYAGTDLPGSANFDANDIRYNVHNVGVKSKGTVTINGAPPAAAADSPTLSWIEGKSIIVKNSASFGNNTTLVASGDLTKVANASNIGGVSTPDIYAGIYVANGASLSTSAGKNLTLIQNGSYKATLDANAYGVYVENGGRIGDASNTASLTIRQIGAITATGEDKNATGIYVAGTVAQGGDVTIDQIGKISAGDKGTATGVNLISGGVLNVGTKSLTINSGNQDITLNGGVTSASLTANAGRDLIIGKDLNLTGDFTANAGGDYNINKSLSANKVTLNVGGSTTIKDSATVTTKNFDAKRIGVDFTQKGKIVGPDASASLPTITINTGRDLTLDNDVNSASLTLTAGRKVTVNKVVTSEVFKANGNSVDVAANAKITSNTSFSAAATKGNVTIDGQVIADKFTASAEIGNVTAINPANQIKSIGELKGDTVKIATFNTEPVSGTAPNVVSFNGNINANNLYIYSSDNATNGTTYSLDGAGMTLSNQAGTGATKLRYISGNDVTGSSSFKVTGSRGKLDVNALLNTLGVTVTR